MDRSTRFAGGLGRRVVASSAAGRAAALAVVLSAAVSLLAPGQSWAQG